MAAKRWRRFFASFLTTVYPDSASWTWVQLAQEVVEVVAKQEAASATTQVAHAPVEVVAREVPGWSRVEQELVEVVAQQAAGYLRIAQECVEVVYPYVCGVPPDAPPVPLPCSTDPVPEAGWAPGPCTGKFRGE